MRGLTRSSIRALDVVAGIGLILMMLQVTADVIGRYLFTMPVPLTMEMVSFYYMTLVAFLPLLALERKPGGMIHVELFYDWMPEGLRRWAFSLAMLLGALYCGIAAYAAWWPAVGAYATGSYVGSIYTIASWPTRFLPAIGFGLLALVYLAKLFAGLRGDVDDPKGFVQVAKGQGE